MLFIVSPHWSLLADPANLSRWNPNARSVDARSELTQTGDTFWLTYQLNGRESTYLARVTALDRPRLLEYELTSENIPSGARMTERYEITAHGDEAELSQIVSLGRSGVPWWAVALISFIHRFGRPTGKRFLETFRELVESGQP